MMLSNEASLLDFIESFYGGTPVKPDLPILLIASCIGLLLMQDRLWPITRNLLTMVHEAGHALMGLVWGRQLTGIKLHSDTSGVTLSRGKPYGLGMMFTLLAGYTAPATLALLLAFTLTRGYETFILLALTTFSFIMLLFIRNFWGLFIVATVLTFGYASVFYLPATAHYLIITVLISFFLTGGVRPIFELQHQRTQEKTVDSDADQLQKITLIPATMWLAFFFCYHVLVSLATVRLLFF